METWINVAQGITYVLGVGAAVAALIKLGEIIKGIK